jgi:dipeptidyl aminopeptidase/acylaminoacyl peptidase
MKISTIILLAILWIIIALFLPAAFRDRQQPELFGPDLSEIRYSEIRFENKKDRISLAGMLMKPEGPGPFPVVIFIHGSGPSYRNSAWYVSVAEHLLNNGIAVILPDKRGCEKSSGQWIGADFNQLAGDVLGAVAYVKQQDAFNESQIGILGMSQGGWIAPVAASQSKDIGFVATMSGASVTTDEQLVYEEINNMLPFTYGFIAKLIAPLTARRINKKAHQKALAGFDPIPYWNQVSVPVFMAFGGEDTNIPVDQCLSRLEANNLYQFLVKVYPRGGHGITDPHSKKVNRNYLDDLVSFVENSRQMGIAEKSVE